VTAINDIVQMVTTATLFGQNVNNVYHYKITTLGTGNVAAEECVESWKMAVMGYLLENQSESYVINQIAAVNLHDPSDFFIDSGTWPGEIDDTTSLGLPSWVTAVFRYSRVSAADRNGYKKIAGLVEAAVTGNGLSGTNFNVATIEAKLFTLIGDGISAGYIFTPFIAHRPITYGTNPTGYVPSGVSFSKVSTQRSRL